MKKVYTIALLIILSLKLSAKDDEVKLFSMYPVPAVTNTLTVTVQPNTNISSLELRSLIGKKLQEKKLNKADDQIVFSEMSQYYNGIYVVVAKDANGKIVETIKFTITR